MGANRITHEPIPLALSPCSGVPYDRLKPSFGGCHLTSVLFSLFNPAIPISRDSLSPVGPQSRASLYGTAFPRNEGVSTWIGAHAITNSEMEALLLVGHSSHQ
uniref:Uncharacterized protein n=1 Tax=Picea sitchensis TaxID=3332 RepID=A0A6B9XWW7_PICSI|nr:hypothetical protein Q903MT_gene5771 [Picea sitchensis]